MEEINKVFMEASEKEVVANKEIRRRKKRLMHQITNQMEFYFSSANITKDKFMSNLLCHDPYIDLETFFKFNKIRAMTNDIEFLRNAISKSSLLKLSDDGMKVRRKEEEKPKEDELQCTIYVENISSNADHEWIREVFGAYGTIDYISLPRYHRSGRPKGFAFVEFKAPEMANSALEAFGALECKIPPTTDPAELQSIKTFERDEQQGDVNGEEKCNIVGEICKESDDVGSRNKRKIDWTIKEGKEIDVEVYNDKIKDDYGVLMKVKSSSGNSEEIESKSMKKMKQNLSEQERKELKEKIVAETKEERKELEECKEKMKRNEEDNETINLISKIEENERKKKNGKNNAEKKEKMAMSKKVIKRKLNLVTEEGEKKRKKGEEKTQSEKNEENMEEVKEEQVTEEGKKKKRKRKRKKKEKELIDSIYLRVMSKDDWKKLRNKYLNAQRDNMKIMKMKMQEQYHYHHHHEQYQLFSRWQNGERNMRFEVEDVSNLNRMREQSLKREVRIRKCDVTDNQNQKMENIYSQCRDENKKSHDRTELNTEKSGGKMKESLAPKFTPHSIIKISFEEPPHDVKKLRETIKEGGGEGVAYVDLSATEKDVYVRFTSSNGASAYVNAGCWSRMKLLSGEEEDQYWRKISSCWNERRSKKTKNKRGQICVGGMRGRDKLLQKALQDAQNTRKFNSHILFDD